MISTINRLQLYVCLCGTFTNYHFCPDCNKRTKAVWNVYDVTDYCIGYVIADTIKEALNEQEKAFGDYSSFSLKMCFSTPEDGPMG
jgi:hypothetical protein